ncbi:unnamed protein product [marine sediment metagenome]|uniref:Uncharacterized protein n=1 Tax=marine sediment metagenome TaxID=412755 RepID=X0V7H1_9ZZZZ
MPDIDWAAICDILASEYGWTLDYIKTLNFGQITTLLKAIKERRDIEGGSFGRAGKVYPHSPKGESGKLSENEAIQMAAKMGGKIEKDKDGKVKKIIM